MILGDLLNGPGKSGIEYYTIMSLSKNCYENGLVNVFTYNKRIEVISFFIEHPDESFRSSDVIEFADISKRTWYDKNKDALLELGIIESVSGKRKYRLNRDNPLTNLLMSIYFYPRS